MPVFSQKRIQFRISLHSDDIAKIMGLAPAGGAKHEESAAVTETETETEHGNESDNDMDNDDDEDETKEQKKKKEKDKEKEKESASKHKKKSKSKGEVEKRGLHLRLFNVLTHEHQEWNTSQCDVCINNRKILIDKRNTRSGVKKKGYHIVAPLDITKEACNTMDFEITSNGPFGGVAVIEIVKIFSVEAIASRIIARCTPIDPRKDKKCAICGRTSDLLRCSRCKCVWYCGTKHQAKDWTFHQTICSPTEHKAKLKPISFKSNDDDVVCGETKVSLRCPLSICRINTPIRGTECTHPQCIDLYTFLAFSHRTGIWQCPVCLRPLKFNHIVIDNEMKQILQGTDDDIDLVRLFPDGSFKSITLNEQREEEARIQQASKRKRKRKQSDTGSHSAGNKQKRHAPNTPPPHQSNQDKEGSSSSRSRSQSQSHSHNDNEDEEEEEDEHVAPNGNANQHESGDQDGNNSAPEDDNGQNIINPIVLD